MDFMCITAWTPYIGEQIDCALHSGYRIPSLLQFSESPPFLHFVMQLSYKPQLVARLV